MRGEFRYIDKNDKVVRVTESLLIPSTAKELIRFHVEPPPPPHTDEDHRMISLINEEFKRVYLMLYKNSGRIRHEAT